MDRGFKLYVMGSSAALPTSTRHSTSFVLKHCNNYFLIDCCEGAQIQMRKFNLPLLKVDHIFISHLHGDHYLGLPGLLLTLHLLGRQKELHVYGPKMLDQIINPNFSIPEIELSYKLTFHTISKGEEIVFSNKLLEVETIEMTHRIETYGFLFKEKMHKKNIKKDAVERYQIPISQMASIKNGANLVNPDGSVIPNNELTNDPPKPLFVAMLGDTAFNTDIIEKVKNADLLYHEATFADDLATIAEEKYHSTSRQAATIASLANVKQMIIGHFSARYKDLMPIVSQAREVFPNTLVAVEGMVVEVDGFTG